MNKNICFKSFNNENSEDFTDLLSKYAADTDGLQVYKAIAYTTGLDRDGEVAEKSFIEELAEKLVGKPVIKNHDWKDVDGTVGTIIKSEVIENDLVVWFYVADEEVKDKLNKGIYKGVSCGFESVSEDVDGVTHLVGCKDAFEMSLVTVPAVPKASIKIKSFIMKEESAMFSLLKKQKLLAQYPSLKSVEPEALDELAKGEIELTEADIEELLNENSELKAKIAELENQIAEYKNAEEKTKEANLVDSEVEKAVEELEVTDEVKEVITEEVKSCISVEDGEVKGLTECMEKIKTKYTKLGLIGQTKAAEPAVENEPVSDVKTKDFGFTPAKDTKKSLQKETVYKVKKGFN